MNFGSRLPSSMSRCIVSYVCNHVDPRHLPSNPSRACETSSSYFSRSPPTVENRGIVDKSANDDDDDDVVVVKGSGPPSEEEDDDKDGRCPRPTPEAVGNVYSS